VSDDDSASDIPEKRPPVAVAACYAAVVFGAIAGSAILKLLLHRILAMPRDDQLWGPFILACILGLFWFALVFLLSASSSNDTTRQWRDASPNGTNTVGRTITRALVIACVLAISAWTGLSLNDAILESRSLPWIAPLITVQEFGFVEASQRFPCQIEGSDIGCEAHKWIPTFLAANSLAYFPFVLITLYSFQHSEATRQTMVSGARLFARWSLLAAGTGLVALQVMHGLNLDTHDSLYPHPGIGHWHFGVWEQVSDVTGTLITIAGLSLPFYLYRAIRGRYCSGEVRTRFGEATSMSATMLVALILGNVY
jgi:hypothetical protein